MKISKSYKISVFAFLIPFLICSSAFAFSNTVKWRFRSENVISGGIAANEKYVFVGDASGNFYALNASNGTLLWTYRSEGSIIGTPSILNNSVIFAQPDGNLICLNISDGSLIWQKYSNENVSGFDSIPDGTAVGDGKVFVSRGSGKLYALDASNGNVLWTYQSDIELRSAPAFGENLVFLGEYNGIFSILNPKTGKRIGGGGAGGAINTLTIKNGNAYASSWDGSVQSFKVNGIIPLWNVKVGDPVTTQPEVNESRIVVGTARGLIVALDEKTGNILWNFETNAGNIAAKPIIVDGLVIVSCSDGIYVLDASSGRKRAEILPEEGGSDSTPLFKNGTVYLAFSNGSVYALK